MPEVFDPNAHDRFVLRQIIKPVSNRYVFTLPTPEFEEDPSRQIAYIEQKRFTWKEDIRFYTDESKTTELMRIKAQQRFDPRAKYTVTDGQGQPIGEFQKVFGKSLLRSTFKLLDENGQEVAIARERKLWVALVRRAVGFIPFVGDFADWLPIAYHFDFLSGETVIGTNSRKFGALRDIYKIDMSADTERLVDRRMVLALTVGQDALQAR